MGQQLSQCFNRFASSFAHSAECLCGGNSDLNIFIGQRAYQTLDRRRRFSFGRPCYLTTSRPLAGSRARRVAAHAEAQLLRCAVPRERV